MIKKFCCIFLFFILFFLLSSDRKNEKTDFKPIKIYNNTRFLIECEIKKGFFSNKINGELYLKNKEFRLLLGHGSEKRIDVGRGYDYFWYWSYYEDNNTLFYSDLENMDLVLKNSYKPSWMLYVFNNINKLGEKYNLIENNEVISTAEILNNKIIFNFLKEKIIIFIEIKNAFNENYDESIFCIPKNKFKKFIKMIPAK